MPKRHADPALRRPDPVSGRHHKPAASGLATAQPSYRIRRLGIAANALPLYLSNSAPVESLAANTLSQPRAAVNPPL
ncbi:hypothetical protein GCM10009565_63420 [Amycolatopsis albidoflavus]